jgi:crotonobetainyl-CoA:carnitine CoA-transferase CaiB-like acyl-CoA transferase
MATFSRTGLTTRFDPPGFGEHTSTVLQASGFSDDEIENLVAKGTVVQGSAVSHIIPVSYR